MIKCASHALYCALLWALSTQLVVPGDPRPNVFFQALCTFCTTALVLAVGSDWLWAGYSSFHNLRLPKAFDPVAVVLFTLVAALNVLLCAGCTTLRRVVLGGSFEHEVAGGVLKWLAYNADALVWNARAPKQAYDFYTARGWNLTAHMWTRGLLRQVGLASGLLGHRAVAYALSLWLAPGVLPPVWSLSSAGAVVDRFAAGIGIHDADASMAHHVIAFAVHGAGYAAWTLLALMMSTHEAPWRYYHVHRWLHDNRTLYTLVHKIHHVARYPIPVDSCTESPLEFAAIAYLFSSTGLLPLAPALILEVPTLVGQHRAHDFTARLPSGSPAREKWGPSSSMTEYADGSLAHRLHHSVNSGNYGAGAATDPDHDVQHGTTIDRQKLPDKVFGLYNFPAELKYRGLVPHGWL